MESRDQGRASVKQLRTVSDETLDGSDRVTDVLNLTQGERAHVVGGRLEQVGREHHSDRVQVHLRHRTHESADRK